ncbi:MAG: hypothetical protein IJE68_02225 [Clostridia bacterium]|nr:hypothetical protein [Clostridia bacterium]
MTNKNRIILIILVSASIIIFGYTLFNREEVGENKTENNIYISKVIEDECTEEYEEIQSATTVVSKEKKLSANAILILKKYYKKCEHTINEYVELPQELVNMTEEETQAEYPDWEVIGFETGKLILYKEFEDVCGEHFKLKVEDDKVVIYIVNNDGTESIYEKTNISSEYLTETDLINMQDGLEIYGKEELNQIIEDFE